MANSNTNNGCLGALLRLFIPQEGRAPATYPYKVRDDFLTHAELSLYHVLTHVAGTNAVVITKVRLADLFYVQRPNENRSAFNRIAQRHIDFLLCHPQTMRPLLGIELDDASHARKERIERDEFLDRAFAAAGLPLLRIPAQRAYNTRELEEKINRYIVGSATSKPDVEIELNLPSLDITLEDRLMNTPPSCPKCGETMVLRKGTRGSHIGESFYGCPNYPKCRTIVPVGSQDMANNDTMTTED